MTVSNTEDFWRKQINEMSASLPEDGENPPEIESIKTPKKKTDSSTKVLVHKVITQIYVFTDVSGKVYTSTSSQKMQIMGTMSLGRALKLAQEDDLS